MMSLMMPFICVGFLSIVWWVGIIAYGRLCNLPVISRLLSCIKCRVVGLFEVLFTCCPLGKYSCCGTRATRRLFLLLVLFTTSGTFLPSLILEFLLKFYCLRCAVLYWLWLFSYLQSFTTVFSSFSARFFLQVFSCDSFLVFIVFIIFLGRFCFLCKILLDSSPCSIVVDGQA